jgi:hypothetical protein
MRTMALALSLFAVALVSEVEFGQPFDAAEAKTTDAKRTAAPQRRHRKQTSKRNDALPPNLGPGIGSGL